MHRTNRQEHTGGFSFSIVTIALLATTLNISCLLDTRTNLCEATGRFCGPEQVCAAAQPVCIPIGGCGDGVIEPGEECDDGNVENGDMCSVNCTLPSCGNQILN